MGGNRHRSLECRPLIALVTETELENRRIVAFQKEEARCSSPCYLNYIYTTLLSGILTITYLFITTPLHRYPVFVAVNICAVEMTN
jgi:hypothetical protein